MADARTPLERLVAIWKAVCIDEGIAHDAQQAEQHIRATFGDLAAQSFARSMKLDISVPDTEEPPLTILN